MLKLVFLRILVTLRLFPTYPRGNAGAFVGLGFESRPDLAFFSVCMKLKKKLPRKIELSDFGCSVICKINTSSLYIFLGFPFLLMLYLA